MRGRPKTPSPAAEMARLLRLDRLPRGAPHRFSETASEAERRAIASLLGALEVGRFRFAGRIEATEGGGWLLEGMLEASIVQSCVVSLRPVATRLRETVRRRFVALAGARELDIDPEEEEIEPLTEAIDLGAIAIEAAALALDPYPRHPEAVLDPRAGGGEAEEADHPFAALARLRGVAEDGG
ncbi:MAG TPA: YceD family protein [Paracoccaceae bacterium]|nr:YceD family protein [Paracoccaceae bacterium]